MSKRINPLDPEGSETFWVRGAEALQETGGVAEVELPSSDEQKLSDELPMLGLEMSAYDS